MQKHNMSSCRTLGSSYLLISKGLKTELKNSTLAIYFLMLLKLLEAWCWSEAIIDVHNSRINKLCWTLAMKLWI